MDQQRKMRHPAPPFQADALWSALARLDRMLALAESALVSTAASNGTPSPALYIGPYIAGADSGRLVRHRPNDASQMWADGGAAAAMSYEARLLWLQQVFGLEAIDLDIILITLAPELDLRYEAQFGHLQGGTEPRPPTVDLALNLLCASREAKLLARAHFAPQAPLSRHHLLRLCAGGSALPTPLLAQAIAAEPSLIHFLLGEAVLDARLRSFARLEGPQSRPGKRAEALGQQMHARLSTGSCCHFSLEGPALADQDAAVASLAARLRMAVLTVALPQMAAAATEFATNLQLLLRDAALLGAVLYLAGRDALADADQLTLAEAISGAPATITVMAGASSCGPRFNSMSSLPVAAATFAERRTLWAVQIGAHGLELAPAAIDELAARYRLTESQIKGALLRVVRQASSETTAPCLPDFAEAACLQMASDPGPLAQRIKPIHQWDDLVLPPTQFSMLKQYCSQARYRHVVYDDWGFDRKLSNGKGLSALFTGPPGTGKTMAVEVIASDLGLEVFKIDLSQVVSKYIGDTEKALDCLFTQAKNANAILFFDECDALFGKRTATQDAHDRYANIEVAYLLQKLEAYEGLCILATNLRQNLDIAFTRRIGFIVEFPFPDEESRRRLWQSVWPRQMPRSEQLDLAYLARQFRLSGGAVKNIALSAAFLAAQSGAELRTEHVLYATRGEIEKSGQRMPESEFGPYAGSVAALASMAGEGAQ